MIERICPKCNVVMNSERCVNSKCGHATVMSSTIYWCEDCNVPTYEKVCPTCGKEGFYIATDIRPVFPEENLLISLLLTGQPFTYQKDSVWYGSNSYIVNGKKVKFSASQINRKPIEELVEIKKRYEKSLSQLSTRMKHYGYSEKEIEEAVMCDDITREGLIPDMEKRIHEPVDIIIGGLPCQAFSTVGRAQSPDGMSSDPRNYLFENYLQILNHFKPKMFIFENVKGIFTATPKGVKIFDIIIREMSKTYNGVQ